VIGYYVHHVGRGHLRRATSIASALDDEVTGLSSSPRPAGWSGPWIELERDDTAPARDPGARGVLHWAPVHDPGLAARMARVAGWIATSRPAALVVDVSVEIAAFARLMGVPVVAMTLPGDRRDPAHQLGFSLAEAILAPWPEGLGDLDRDLSSWADRVHHVGGVSRFAGRRLPAPAPGPRRRVLVLQGTGGTSVRPADVAAAARATPDWDWHRLGPGAWSEDPWPELCAADVVVTHAGLGAIGDVAAADRPAVVIPEDRPHDEQRVTARALADAGLAVTSGQWPSDDEWPGLLERALDAGSGWRRWGTDGAAERAARVIEAVAVDQNPRRSTSCA
jgi:hypothetical protein